MIVQDYAILKGGRNMKILIADDEKMMRLGMKKEVLKILPDAEILLADSGDAALEIFKENEIPLVFLDVEMPGLNGLEVAKLIKDIKNDVNIIMTTAYPNYAVDAYKLHIGGYLMKPVDSEDIRSELNHLAYPLKKESTQSKLTLKCFGEFKVMYAGKTIHFSRTKSKEILAYLTAKNGASASRNELCEILWEDDNHDSKKSYIRVLIMDLKNSLKEIGMEDVLVHNRNAYNLKTDMLDCDYYEFLKGDPDAKKAYKGEFMNQYSWGENYIWDIENHL